MKDNNMNTHYWPRVGRTVRFGLVIGLVGTALWSCGGAGGSNESGNTTPTELQANPTTPWELFTAGDIAQCNLLRNPNDAQADGTARLVERQLALAGANSNVLTLGDNAYALGASIGYSACYGPTWGRFMNKTFAIPGNHDYENNGDGIYFKYFGAKASPDGKDTGYYRIDQSGWTVFALSSVTDASAASAQATWLKQQLATAKPCVAAAWHHARFSSAPDGDNNKMAAIWDILEQAKADIVLQSHEHHYERFAPMLSDGTVPATGGLRSFVVGTGGAEIYPHARVRAGSEKQLVTYGVMRLSLESGKAAWRFIDTNDAVLDQGNFNCRVK
jgi:acid phosphatase type 7